MKSVLISIKPKYCELIANGKKIIDVRKTRPKIETPFKCYIYCTNGKIGKRRHLYINEQSARKEHCITETWRSTSKSKIINPTTVCEFEAYLADGKVIGEFVCDRIEEYNTFWLDGEDKLESTTCLDDGAIMEYMNCFTNRRFYCWHISDLKIYDKPKELGEFRDIKGEPIKRPFQSWGYIND